MGGDSCDKDRQLRTVEGSRGGRKEGVKRLYKPSVSLRLSRRTTARRRYTTSQLITARTIAASFVVWRLHHPRPCLCSLRSCTLVFLFFLALGIREQFDKRRNVDRIVRARDQRDRRPIDQVRAGWIRDLSISEATIMDDEKIKLWVCPRVAFSRLRDGRDICTQCD